MPTENLHAAVLAADERRYAALINLDMSSLGSLLADELIYTHGNGLSQTKRELVDAVSGGALRYRSAARSNEAVRLYGDVAVHTGRVRIAVTVKGDDIAIENAFVMVWVLRDARWQLVQWQSTRLQS
jgi:hypothetical protein